MARKTTASLNRIERTPGVVGGRARIQNTRIPVWTLISYRRLGLSDKELLLDYPTLGLEDLQAAWAYYEQHRSEIDKDIREQDQE